jgi:hypothetical protein
MGIATLLRYVVAAGCSVLFGTLDHQALVWPPVVEIATSLPAAWLIGVSYASFGACLAFIFRRSAMAYGFGLTYLFVIEDRVVSILGQSGGPGPNATALVDSFGAGLGGGVSLDTQRAALTLVAYTALALAVSAVLLLRRDVT